jgi:Fe-S-cluster-containing hydrogenase component 2
LFKLKMNGCTNCRICELACVWAHERVNGVRTARVRIKDNWPKHPDIKICLACKGHECVEACPEEALHWDNWVHLDADKCTGCQSCVDACPVAGVHWDEQAGLPLICDACQGLHSCAKQCPTGAITLGGVK